jgi:ectoine hydroxylase-related dioxygenase (phytanoyl-CoA dioxygenase family)
MSIQAAPRLDGGLRTAFERDGYAVVRGALATSEVDRLTQAVDRAYAGEGGDGSTPLHLLAFCGREAAFLELLDHPSTLPLVVDLLGSNVFMYHCHLDVHPPEARDARPWMWHQDGGVVNRDLETDPRPRLSVKVGYFLTDCSEPGRGNFVVLPGSHVRNGIARPADDSNDLAGAVPILARPGDAVLFDRRLWHMRSPNDSSITRKALFYAYTYRWVRARDDLHVRPELLDLVTPARAQLLGSGSSADHFWMPDHVDLPLRSLAADPRSLTPAAGHRPRTAGA